MTEPAIKAAGPKLVPILAEALHAGISEDGLGRSRITFAFVTAYAAAAPADAASGTADGMEVLDL